MVWTKLSILSWTYFWPGVLAVLLVAAYDRSRRWQVLGVYFGVFAGLMVIAVERNPDLGLLQLPVLGADERGRVDPADDVSAATDPGSRPFGADLFADGGDWLTDPAVGGRRQRTRAA